MASSRQICEVTNGNSECKHFDLSLLLLNARATTDVTCTCHGRGPLINAVERGDVALSRLLIEHGADVSQVDQTGATPMLTACVLAHIEIVEMFLASGTSVVIESGRHAGKAILEFLSGAKMSGMPRKDHLEWCKRRDQVLSLLQRVTPRDSAQPAAAGKLALRQPEQRQHKKQAASSSKQTTSSKKMSKANKRGKQGLARPPRQDEGEGDEVEEQPTADSSTSGDSAAVARRHGTAGSGCNCEGCVEARESLQADGTNLRAGLASLTPISVTDLRNGTLDFLSLQNDCAFCGTPSPEDTRHKACTRCRQVRYCNSRCQEVAWKQLGHKESCGRPLPSVETVMKPFFEEVLGEGDGQAFLKHLQYCGKVLREFGQGNATLSLLIIRLMRTRIEFFNEQFQLIGFLSMGMAGVFKPVQEAVEAHKSHPELASQGLSFLAEGRMSLQQIRHFKQYPIVFTMGDSGTVHCVISVMAANQSSGEVQQVASVLLATMAGDQVEMQSAQRNGKRTPQQLIMDAGGLRRIVPSSCDKGRPQ